MNAALILIVEDEPKMASVISDYLSQQGGYRTLCCDRGDQAVGLVREHQPDLLVLDVMLPGMDGMAVCRAVREFSLVPVIMATARVEEIDRLLGLELGADDYLCKPYSPRELVARVKALLRRAQYVEQSGKSTIVVDEAAHSARFGQTELSLTRVEFSLLQCLLKTPGRVYSRQQLIDRIYQDYRIVSDRTVDTHIKNLRRKLAEAAPGQEYIESVYGVGYKLVLPC
ncbi:MAG: response regulator [Wenzhouxiangellaceae bacterium]